MDPGDTVSCEWICVYAQGSDDSWAWKFPYCDDGNMWALDTNVDFLEWFLEVTDDEQPVQDLPVTWIQ